MKKPESVAQQKLREYIEKKNLSKQFGEEKATNILKQRQQRYKIRGQSQR
jgi:hypothetical protein